jgi:signal transduction histidine kinase/ActR/RegA family two-component response regulator
MSPTSLEAIVPPPDRDTLGERVLILAPIGRDATLAAAALRDGSFACHVCRDIEELCAEIERGAGAVMITEEALSSHAVSCLRDVFGRQPAWSDFPLIVFTSQPYADFRAQSNEAFGVLANVTLLERPIRVRTMISAARAALRARKRQYEVRDLVGQLHGRIEERDQFLAMLGHELRNPLAAITLAIESLRLDQHDTAHEILLRQTRHLKQLVDDLLEIGRITSGKIILHRTEVDLADIVAHCVESMRARASARHLDLRLHRDGPVFVDGDAVRLEQIANNLLSNAIKYTPGGGSIDISVGRRDGEAVLRVRDSGRGIDPELLHRIFDLFMQADVTVDRAEGGMGIGLTLVRKLAELHGGIAEAHSDGRGSGSEFVVRIPAITPSAFRQPERRAANAVSSPKLIVVIEDNADIRVLLRAELTRLGHKVDDAGEGADGLQTILHLKPDVALIDIGLPGMDGYAIARHVRQSLGRDVLLVALSGYGQAEDRARAHEAGFDIHLTKPAGITELENVLSRARRD